MAVYICVHCGQITHCDFFPCLKCRFAPQMSDLCLKILEMLSDDVSDVCQTCHEIKEREKRVLVVSSENHFPEGKALMNSIKAVIGNIAKESTHLSEKEVADCCKQPKNALTKASKARLRKNFIPRRFR